jgi:hypothetical protein
VLVVGVVATIAVAPAALSAAGVVTGRVFDVSVGTDAGIHLASVELHIPGASGGATSATTDVDGSFAISLPPGDDTLVFMSVTAQGYFPFNQWFSGVQLRASPLAIGLAPAPARVDTTVSGLVYNAAVGRDAPIAGALIQYTYHSYNDAFPGVSGALQTGADGRYRFEQPLGNGDFFELSVAAPGFAPFVGILSAGEVLGGVPRDFGLAPVGGVVRLEPDEVHLDCPQTFTVTITNVGAPDETLVILGVALYFHYGEGVYGMAFDVDLSQIQFPVLLASGEQLTFPVTFVGGGSFPTLLNLDVVSGARGGGSATYYGGFHACTTTCAGDCDGSGGVTIDELIEGVAIVLGERDVGTCPSLDTDGDGALTVAELVAAVAHALGGCGSTP